MIKILADSQKLGQAYENLKDEDKRRRYDLIYLSLKCKTGPSQYTHRTGTTPGPTSHSGTISEAAQIAALQKQKQERAARWHKTNVSFESSIFEIRRAIRRTEQEIQGLDSIVAAEAAEKAQRSSWSAWLLSPIYKTAEDSDEEKASKESARQERRIERDMKERRLAVQKANVEATEASMRAAKTDMDAANTKDEGMIQYILYQMQIRETRQRQERERLERENLAQQMRQQRAQREQREREAAKALRKQEAARRAAEQDKYKEQNMERQRILEELRRQRERHTYFNQPHDNTSPDRTATCRHDGWWPKVQGRTVCPECGDCWTYLLRCPGCDMKACPRCQAAVRPRRPRNATKTGRRTPPRVRTPSPGFPYGDYW